MYQLCFRYSDQHIVEQLNAVTTCLDNKEQVVNEQVKETFNLLDENTDGMVSREEWVGQLNAMPKFLNKFRNMCVSVLSKSPVFMFARLEGQASIAALEQLKGVGIDEDSAMIIIELYTHFGSAQTSPHSAALPEKGFGQAIMMACAFSLMGKAAASTEGRLKALSESDELLDGIGFEDSNILARAFSRCSTDGLKAITLTQFGSWWAEAMTNAEDLVTKMLGWKLGKPVEHRDAVHNLAEAEELVCTLWSNVLLHGYGEASLERGQTPREFHTQVAALKKLAQTSSQRITQELAKAQKAELDTELSFADLEWHPVIAQLKEMLKRSVYPGVGEAFEVDTSCIGADERPELIGLELEKDQEESLIELYTHYGGSNGVIREDKFNRLLVETFCYSLLKHRQLDAEAIEWLRGHIKDESLLQGVDLTSALFWRSWEWFDEQGKGFVDLADLGAVLCSIASQKSDGYAKYLFFLTDLNDNGTISEEELVGVYTQFMELYGKLSLNILNCDAQRLVASGMSSTELEQRVSHIKSTIAELNDSMLIETFTAFEVQFKRACLVWY